MNNNYYVAIPLNKIRQFINACKTQPSRKRARGSRNTRGRGGQNRGGLNGRSESTEPTKQDNRNNDQDANPRDRYCSSSSSSSNEKHKGQNSPMGIDMPRLRQNLLAENNTLRLVRLVFYHCHTNMVR